MSDYKETIESAFRSVLADALDEEKKKNANLEWVPMELVMALLMGTAGKLTQQAFLNGHYETHAEGLIAFGLPEELAHAFAAKIAAAKEAQREASN